jgi:alanyl-tRNA synthetase
MTERLYYEDAYTLNFTADVVERTDYRGQPAVVLDRTYFYPESGGQPYDLGLLNATPVVAVQSREADRAVLHVLQAPLPDQRVEAQIDAARRFDHMQHHSGQHVLSQALSRVANADTLSIHMSAESMTIDVNRAAITPEAWLAVEQLANQIVQADHAVRCWYPMAPELAALPIRKLPDVVGKVRIVDIGGFDVTACGGTHVARTGEIGLIKVIKAERRGDSTRLEFRCGSRAVADYRTKNEVLNQLAAELTIGYWQVPDAIKRLQAENKALRAEIKLAKDQLAEAESQVWLAAAQQIGAWKVIVNAFDERDANEVRLLAQKIAAHPDVVVLFGVAGEKAQVIFTRASNVTLDVVPLLKHTLALLNSERGGGKPDFAQGGGVPATLSTLAAALASARQQLG